MTIRYYKYSEHIEKRPKEISAIILCVASKTEPSTSFSIPWPSCT